MSADSGPSSAAGPNLNLSPEEKRLYGQLFRQADSDSVGVVTGDVAVTFFEKTRLDSATLGEIWQIADKENRGFLTPAGFGIVLRLIGHAQNGRKPTADVALQRGPLPRFDGITPGTVSSPGPVQGQTTGPIRIPPLTQDKVAQYTGLFERQTLQNNMLPGEQAREIFDKSGLPNETLGRIWGLADTEARGALTQTEFIISMHLLTSMKSGALRGLPNVLPSGLYEAAAGRSQSPRPTGMPPLNRQLSGTPQNRTGSPLARGRANDWAVSAADKAKFDQLYADLDKNNTGFISGEQAVPFFSRSNLPEDTLAQVWDLADVNSSGQLSKDEFAVAMYLIRQQRVGGSGALPSTLPANLVPPSMRTQAAAPPSAFQPPPMKQPPPPAQTKSALDDLFGLESSTSSPAPAQTSMSTGGSAGDPFAGGTPTSPTRASTTGTFKPFVPTSSFGRSLANQPSDSGTAGSTQQSSGADDLLGDNDPEASKNISGESTELANLSNQIGTLSKEMQNVQGKRTTTQNELGQTNSQKQNFEQRLAQLRQLYEKEAKDTRSLEEQLKKSRIETQKLQGECMTLEGNCADMRQQHQQLSNALQADQQENSNLRERIRVANASIAQLKPQIEKLKSDGRQQKGLVAINKKQLSTTEGERDKLKTEAEGLESGAGGGDDQSRQLETGSPVSTPNRIASPALSTGSGNNPFFKRTQSTDIMGTFATSQPKKESDRSFDEVFGSSGPQPPAPFKPQTTGTSTASTGSVPNAGRQKADNPPPPPESRQISSSYLPFQEQPSSLTSSRVVSPPASHAGGSAEGTASSEQTETADKEEPAEAFSSTGTKVAVGAGAGAAALAATAVAGSSLNNNASTTSFDEATSPFQKDDLAKAKSDFDSAFASFNNSKKSTGSESNSNAKSAFDTEFPPINEFDGDDSDTESESGSGGFDDDFAPGSPEAKRKEKETSEQKPNTEETSDSKGTADSAAGSNKDAPEEATKDSELPSSPATVTNKTATGETAEDIFGAAAASSTSASKGDFDDLDDDFEGLEDAKEGSADEDFANISRSGLEDYNPVFDSSPPASQAKSDSTAFGNESSFDFVSANPQSGGGQSKGSESHDWDAIFAGLDSADPVATQGVADPASADKPAEESRPAAGRALTDKGEHDDPILKNLTGMGYSRTASLAALEKYDYNLERAANYLASQS